MRKKRGLRNWVLLILRRRPRNGVEIMEDMEVMTRGWWRPSPGSVYPLLEEMVKEGSIRRKDDGRYELVDSDDQNWGGPPWFGPRTPQEVVQEIAGLTAYLEDLKRNEPTATNGLQSDLDGIADRLHRLRA